jgi:hypothetical protein
MIEITPCLYCQTENSVEQDTSIDTDREAQVCCHCGMPLPRNHPQGSSHKSKIFVWAFLLIVIFCLVMIIYLPR